MKTNVRNVTIAIFIATFLSAIEGTIVGTALPKMVSDLSGMEMMSWVVSAYLVTLLITTPIYGKLADLFGRKVMFTIGIFIFLIGSTLCGLAETMPQLIIFRAIQGLGAGALSSISFTIIGDIYSFEQRAKVQGWLSSVWGIAGIIGPLVGGVLVDYVSWRWVFYLNIPFGIVSILLLWISLHEEFEKRKRHIDYGGIITFTVAIISLLYILDRPWESTVSPMFLGASILCLIIFFIIERKSPEPLIPLQLFSIRSISVANLAIFLLGSVFIVISFHIPLWIQGVYGAGATYSGLVMMPISITWPLCSIMAGRLIPKRTLRFITLLGSVIVFVGCSGLALASVETPVWLFMIYTALIGAGMGFATTTYTVAVQSAVDWKLRGISVASFRFMQSLGQTIGIAVFTTISMTQTAKYLSEHLSKQDSLNIDVSQIFNNNHASSISGSNIQSLKEAIAFGLHKEFLILSVIALLTCLVSMWMTNQKSTEETKQTQTAKFKTN
ncbi:MDR family MFS transporter [Bacillus tropicus]|uniref:MDR family MFS transporter n=1 Tax=Bacillus tropicus TaxID=2026188 RepID=UPI0011A539FB|nr:MDR family MFS transporter [Bacillus tropicus]